MMLIETYNIPLIMDEANVAYWLNMLQAARDAFNFCVNRIAEAKCGYGLKTVHKLCYYPTREAFPTLSSQMAIKCLQAAAAALKSRQSNGHHGALPHRKALALVLDKRLYGVLNINGITLTGVEHKRRVLATFALYPKAEEMLREYKAGDPTIFYRDGRFFLAVPFEVPVKPVSNDDAIGVDVGLRQLFVTSEGKSFTDKEYLDRRRKVRYLKDQLKSKGTKSARRHLRKLRHKERNMSKDMCYRAAHALIESTDAGTIVMEDLSKIKQNTSKTKDGHKRKKHNNAMSQVPFYQFRQIVEQKAQLAGKQVETVSPTYTSQIDSRTNKKDGQRKGRRYICSDGVVLDADWNAAINIVNRSQHPVSSPLPIEGRLTPLTGWAPSTAQSYLNPLSSDDGLTSSLL